MRKQTVARFHALAHFRERYFSFMKIQFELSNYKYIASCISALFLFLLSPMIEFSVKDNFRINLTSNDTFNIIWILLLIALSIVYVYYGRKVLGLNKLLKNIFNEELGGKK